jgi:phage terminase large subunit-like protein
LPKGHGARKRVVLAEFQKDWIREVLSSEITSAAMSISRGNGKSTLLAGVATWALFDPDEFGSPQIPVVATTVRQAARPSGVYGVARAFINLEPELKSRCIDKTANGSERIEVPFSYGEMFPIANTVDGLQGLDPSLAVCDEIGFQPIDSWQSLVMASGKRPRSLVVGIGTPGIDRSTSALWHLREKWMDGTTIPGFSYKEFAAPPDCHIEDREAWRIANPALAEGFLAPEAIETDLGLAPEGSFRLFRLGQWIDGIESWLGTDGYSVWTRLIDPYDFDLGEPVWMGVDVALKHDTTAVALVQRRPDERFHAKARIWIPEKDKQLDITDVMHYIREMYKKYNVQGISYDNRFFDVPAGMLLDEGLPMKEIPQSPERMTPACGSAYELIMKGELSHDGDRAFTQHVLNAVPKFQERGFTLQKMKSRGKIDACIAMILALDLSLREPGAGEFFIL